MTKPQHPKRKAKEHSKVRTIMRTDQNLQNHVSPISCRSCGITTLLLLLTSSLPRSHSLGVTRTITLRSSVARISSSPVVAFPTVNQPRIQVHNNKRGGDGSRVFLSSAAAASDEDEEKEKDNVVFPDKSRSGNNNGKEVKKTISSTGVEKVFKEVDKDGSGAIDMEEFSKILRPAGYSPDEIQATFSQMDSDANGEITLKEFHQSILLQQQEQQAISTSDQQNDDLDVCPRGYFLNSVQQAYVPLGPIGRISQRVEMLPGPFQRMYKRISNLFGIDTKSIKKMGVSFALSYSIISNLNGALSLSAAWYISCKRTGLSPLVPGQWKNLFSSYAMIYGFIQIFKPFRVAAAIAMSKLSAEYLEMTQTKLNCSRAIAVACQYLMGQVVMAVCASIGITIVSIVTGVPIFVVGT